MRAFVEQRLNSVEQIAVLLLLRANPDRAWSVEEISKELRSTASAIERRLADLETSGVLTPANGAGTVKYTPSSRDISDAVTQLAGAYRDQPARIIELIYSKPPYSIRAFADAFKLKKDKS